MSKKWQRNKAWEDENLVGPMVPVRIILRVFSSIPLAVVLLLFVSLYATMASIPVGMIARIPTLLIVSALYLALLAIFILPALYFTRKALVNKAPPVRFLAMFVTVLVLGVALSLLWRVGIWPSLKYHDDGSGFMLMSGIVEKYKSTTIRRLPAFEMTETQFYAWWPMRLALVLFVINMVVATVRRIEFNFKNLGVLSVHTGIVIIALGSIFYQRMKLEGDTLLPASNQTSIPGPSQRAFYDREDVALYVAQARTPNAQPRFEQRRMSRLPLYNAYGLEAGLPDGATTLSQVLQHEWLDTDEGRTISQPIPAGPGTLVDPDIQFRVVGFAPYAELEDEWYEAPVPTVGEPNPYRKIDLYFTRGATPGVKPDSNAIFMFPFFLGEPANRIRFNDLMAIEYTRGMEPQRWDDLRTQFGAPFSHGIIVEIPETGFRVVLPIDEGTRIPLGKTGWTISVEQLAQEPPFPIITPGYENATSSVAIINMSKAATETEPARNFSRWVFHRFPELNQDLTPSPTGRPVRTPPDPSIRVSYIDASKLQIYLDETQNASGEDITRAIVRQPTGEVRVIDSLDDGWLLDLIPNEQSDRLDLHLGETWAHAQQIKRPLPTPFEQRDKSVAGSYSKAFLGIEVSVPARGAQPEWSQVVWLPFVQYVAIQTQQRTKITLPDGRNIMLAFGRYQHPFPGFALSLVDFEMIAYDFRGAPRDYQSIVRVSPDPIYPGPKPNFEEFQHVVKLNNPLRAPYHWNPDKAWITNMFTRLRAGLDPRQFKLSQSGWDRQGWQQSQQMVDEGLLDKPRASFTILGVGNNPGIHVIAFGSILISIGIPWAFYFKPYLVRREKERLAALHKSDKAKEASA